MSPSKPWNAKREQSAEPDERGLQPQVQSLDKTLGQANLRELLKLARERGVKGRSTMNKEELEQALGL
jgi:hypothetical protein